MEKFLYGATIKGIQSFIFETNELKDIVGASEIVEQICTEDFKKFLNGKLKSDDNPNGTVEKIISAAGIRVLCGVQGIEQQLFAPVCELCRCTSHVVLHRLRYGHQAN